MLEVRKVLIDWARRDETIFLNVFADSRPRICDTCKSESHSTSLCPLMAATGDSLNSFLRIINNNAVGGQSGSSSLSPFRRTTKQQQQCTSDSRGRPLFLHNGQQIYNYINDGVCTRTNCPYLHLCLQCHGPHSKNTCSSASQWAQEKLTCLGSDSCHVLDCVISLVQSFVLFCWNIVWHSQ